MYPILKTEIFNYKKQVTNVDAPEVIGFFSLDAKRQCSIDASQLKYIRVDVKKNIKFDLNLGADKTNNKEDIIDEKLSNLLHFLIVKEKDLNLPFASSIAESSFYCNRGLLTTISVTPFENKEPWRIVATLFKGDIYLCKRLTDKYLSDVENMDQRYRMATHWGHKFEHFLTSLSPKNEPNPNEILNENEEFNVVFKTKINKHILIFAAEMDGLICNENTEPIADLNFESVINYLKSNEFIELKTNSHLDNQSQQNTFRRFKLMKWWAQNHIVGVDKILCGLRDYDGVINKLKLYTLSDVMSMGQRWEPKICKNFLDEFLSYVKRCLALEIKMKHGEKTDFLKLPIISLHFECYPRAPVQVTNNYNYESDPILTEQFVKDYGKVRIVREIEN